MATVPDYRYSDLHGAVKSVDTGDTAFLAHREVPGIETLVLNSYCNGHGS